MTVQSSAHALPPLVCLSMIVKDEAHVIRRCLESAAPFVDAYLIVDTGSRDETPRVIETCMQELGVSGEVLHAPWVNFGANRSDALRRAREKFAGDPRAFALVLDADDRLEVTDADAARRQLALIDQGELEVTDHGITYARAQLFRLSKPFRYEGVLHEYATCDEPVRRARVGGLRYVRLGGGGRSLDPKRAKRDVDALEKALLENPKDERSMYYLAQTHRDAGNHRDAAKWYGRRARAGGWAEEAWHARYRRAEALLSSDRIEEGLGAALEAYSERPTRAEPLLLLSRWFRDHGRHEAACTLAEAGAKIDRPAEDYLFVEEEPYAHGFDRELSISGYYSASPERRRAAREANMHLTTCRGTNDGTRYGARSNARHYATPLFERRDVSILAIPPISPGMVATNTSVAERDGRLYAVVRTTNYVARRNERGEIIWPNPVMNENYLVELDLETLRVSDAADATPITMTRISCPDPRVRCSGNVLGYEDPRIFWWRGAWWGISNVRDRTAGRKCEMVLYELLGEREIMLTGYGHGELNEKNWMPVVDPDSDSLRVAYSLDPTVVLEVGEDDAPREVLRHEPGKSLDHLRGGSQIVPWRGDRWLVVIHEVVDDPHEPMHRRRYMHRFVELDREMRVDRVSHPFVLVELSIEYCAGLARIPGEEAYVMTFGGFSETLACAARIQIGRIEELLEEGDGSARLEGPEGHETALPSLKPRPTNATEPAPWSELEALDPRSASEDAISAQLHRLAHRGEDPNAALKKLLSLSKRWREAGRNDLSMAAARAAATLPLEQDERHAFDEEVEIAGYYSSRAEERDEARRACMRLTIDPRTSSERRALALSNARFHARPLFDRADVSFLDVPLSPGMSAMNTSIARIDDALYAIVRATNYPGKKDARGATLPWSWPIDQGGSVRSENCLVRVVEDRTAGAADVTGAGLRAAEPFKMRFENPRARLGGNVRGYEDCRLIHWRGAPWAVANVRDRTGGARCQMVLFEVHGEREKMLTSYGHARAGGHHEKNWVPLVDGDDLYFIYSAQPTVILKLDENLEPREHARSNPPFALQALSGGSQAIAWQGRDGDAAWLYVAHHAVPDADEPLHRRSYLHRFVELDAEKRIRRVSPIFTFLERGVEYCAGIARDPSAPESLVVGFGGFAETRSCVARITEARVRALLDEGEDLLR